MQKKLRQDGKQMNQIMGKQKDEEINLKTEKKEKAPKKKSKKNKKSKGIIKKY